MIFFFSGSAFFEGKQSNFQIESNLSQTYEIPFVFAAVILLHSSAQSQGCSVNYVTPNFQIQATDPGCDPSSGRIDAVNVTGGVGPFTFKLVETGATNNTGIFTNLSIGLYTVELRDACGTVRARQVTLVPWSFSFTYTVTKTSACSDGRVEISTSPATGSYQYGIVKQGDTTWSNASTFDLKLYKTLTILVKDACGVVHSQVWHAPNQFLPYIDELQHRLQCDKFDIFPVFYGFNAPNVCLYELGTNQLIACKQAPAGVYSGGAQTNFFDIPWGQYYVIVSDSCYRDSMYHPDLRSAGGSELNPYNWDCNMFTMHVDGMEDTVCLYNATTNQLISCKGQDSISINPRTGVPWPSGAVWDSLPYGSYYAWIYDPCMDSTFRIDSTVNYRFRVNSSSNPICDFNQTRIITSFDPATKMPCTTTAYYPNGTLAGTQTSLTPSTSFGFSIYPGGGTLKIISSDGCGNTDTSYLQQVHTEFEKSVTIQQKCPGVNGNGGSGDINLTTRVSEAYIQTVPVIIKKDGMDTTVNYDYYTAAANNGQTFSFANLLTGVYIVRYNFLPCSGNEYYDTVEIRDYVYPTQNPDSAIQCGGNQFTFTFPVVGGLNPYTFQIVGNTPVLPSLVTAVQASPTFTVGNSQHYTNVQVRAIDRCGNSTIGDVAVRPINGCSILPTDNPAHAAGISNSFAKVYPNPAHEQFTIAISQKKKTNYAIEVISTAGVVVYKNFLLNVDKKELSIKRTFVPGMYFIRIHDVLNDKESFFKQIIK